MIQKYIRFPGFKNKVFTFSYDDGVFQDKRLINIMQKNGLKGTFNLCSGLFGVAYGAGRGHLSKQEAVELYGTSGIEVAVHGYKHLSLASVDVALALDDIHKDRRELEHVFRCVITGMAYANGSYNDEIVEILKKSGIEWARIAGQSEKFDLPIDWMKWQGTCHHNHPRLMELAKEFIEQNSSGYYWANTLQMFYLWGHSYEFDDNNNWDVIERFAEYIGGRENIWYATNGEIYAYLKAATNLLFGFGGELVKNPSCIDVYIDYLGKQCVVPAGKTVKIENGELV